MALDGIRMPDGCYADGTWELNILVTDMNRDVTLRVTGEVHIGGVMLKLVEKLGKFCVFFCGRLLPIPCGPICRRMGPFYCFLALVFFWQVGGSFVHRE